MNLLGASLAGAVAALALAGCNLPAAQPKPTMSVLDQAATIVAATLGPQGAATGAKPASASATPSPTAAVTATATTKPALFIKTDGAQCRSGAGTDFKEIAAFAAGTTVDMVAKDTTDGYWLVKDPTSGSSCWVSVQDATPSGSFDLLPEITPPPVAAEPPTKPTLQNWNYNCDNTSLTVILAWAAPPGNVNGYRVYREGTKVADLPASTTTYTETIDFTFGSTVDYAVEAFNDAGAGPQATHAITCP
jgi:hypothetical protein